MLVAIICGILAIACLTQGAVEGAIALGIAAVGIYFLFGSKSTSGSSKPQQKQPEEKRPDPQHRATPSMVAHYRTSPVVAQIIRDLRENGAEESLIISEGGDELIARGGGYYRYVFKDHGYQPLSIQEQEAFLRAIVEQLPYAETYSIGYTHRENSTKPLNYSAGTSYYRENQYRWNAATHTWEKMQKL